MRHSFALVLLLAATTSTFAAAEQEVRHNFQSTAQRGGIRRLVIELPTGSILVKNGDPNRLSLAGYALRTYDVAGERKSAQAMVDGSSVEIYVSGDEAILRRRFTGAADAWRAKRFTEFTVVVEVPPGLDVDFETNAGEVKLEGTFGKVDVDLRAGEITMTTPKAVVKELNASARVGEVKTHFGNQIVEREGVLPGRTRYKNAAGTSRINLHVTAGEVNVTLTQ
ncbi:MAG TPA: hypothetical protein VF618_28035 [Thermoanaerobaculia bacterium]